ncbi:unnamed protein product [Caenorhabditis bovis]|uniref:Rho-GAP domain-containing protein n=1 Tax=Caenorhabditis bovis TaxID=2654633 RepID=A0A8S1ECW8_9PELO|nr:unnamed protein product [Caenorhabditis bovis]
MRRLSATQAPTSSNRQRYTLGEVNSANIVIDVNVGHGWTRIRLKEVPKFLVYAFNMISMYGMNVDGIFRKEGNSTRLNRVEVQNIYRGFVDIPSDYTVIDVCTLVKRFLRDLKPTLIDSDDFRVRLLNKAQQARLSNNYQLGREEMADLVFGAEPPMSEIHLSTLGYVMRQMNRIATYADQHKMSIDNLAMVMVCSIFGNWMNESNKKINPGRRSSQDDILAAKKHDMNIHVAAVKLLIVNANFIGLLRDPYLTSSHMIRSSSAMPKMRCGSSAYDSSSDADATQTTASTSNGNVLLTPNSRRDSEFAHHVVTSRKKEERATKKKRSSSFLPRFRDIRDRVSFLKRMKSPSPERSNTLSTGSTSSGRQSRSHQSKRGNTNAARRNGSDRSTGNKPTVANFFECESKQPSTSVPLRRLSQSEQNQERGAEEKLSAYEFLLKEYNGSDSPATRILVNNDHTSEQKKKKVRRSSRSRRHTAPVNNGISRNRPNATSTRLPQRRATVLISKSEEKENHKNSETDDSLDSFVLNIESSKAILEQKSNEARLRRENQRQKVRNAITESLVVLNGSMAVTESSSSIANNQEEEVPSLKNSNSRDQLTTLTEESPQKPSSSTEILQASDTEASSDSTTCQNKYITEVKKCDVATSPVVFPSPVVKTHENGHVWVGSKQVVSTESPQLARRQSRARLSYSKANESQLEMPPKEATSIARVSVSPIMQHVTQTNNCPPSEVVTTPGLTRRSTSRLCLVSTLAKNNNNGNESTSSIPPPVPVHSPPHKISECQPEIKIRRPPTPPSNPAMLSPLSPRLPRSSSSNRLDNANINEFKLPHLPKHSKVSPPLFRQPKIVTTRNHLRETKSFDNEMASTSKASNSFSGRATMSPRTADLFGIGKYNHLFQSATEEGSLPTRRQSVEMRPSVAIIRANNPGLVRSRIHHFQEIEQLSKANDTLNGRMSAMSQLSIRSNDTVHSARSSDAHEHSKNRINEACMLDMVVNLRPFDVLDLIGVRLCIWLNGDDSYPTEQDFWKSVWNSSKYRLATDGSANKISKRVIHLPDQDFTDLQKTIKFSLEMRNNETEKWDFDYIILLGGLNGRLDHSLSTLSTLVKYSTPDIPIFSFDAKNVALVIQKGEANVQIHIDKCTKKCGIVPLVQRETITSTKGFRWDLGNLKLQNLL